MDLLKPKVKAVRSLSPVWIIPLVTLAIAVWLGLNSWQQRGTEVEIIFDQASGITVGQTEVRLKDVPVGKVTDMRLSSDLSKVRVRISLDRQISDHLTVNSRFWLVSPRVSTSGVSNLGTLISGVYIVMDPGEPGEFHTTFRGLVEPPAVKSDDKGTQYILLADRLGSLDIGSPVYYRSVRVGEVTGYRLGNEGANVEIRIFIKAPHDKMVYTRTHFWNVSGFGLTIGADGIKAQMASLASLISGGVAFENIVDFETSKRAPSDHSFNLYADKESIVEGRYTLRYYYLLKFSRSVRGLSVGAPVEFRGIKVGEVLEVSLHKVTREADSLHVIVGIEPQRLNSKATPTREEFDNQMESLIKEGLRAQLRNGSLITGARYVALSFPPDAIPRTMVRFDQFSELPTQESAAENLEQQMAEIATKINKIPIVEIGKELNQSLAHIGELLKTLEEKKTAEKLDTTLTHVGNASKDLDKVVQQMNNTFAQMEQTLRSVESVVAPDSRVQFELQQVLQALTNAANSLDSFLLQLHEKPDALIFGDD